MSITSKTREIEVAGHRIVLREISYGESIKAAREAERTGAEALNTMLLESIVSWDFTDPTTGNVLPKTMQNLLDIRPIGLVNAIISAFNEINLLDAKTRKK